MQQKKITSLGNSDDRADQKTDRNDYNTFGIPRANLKLKHMFILFIICSFVHNLFQHGAMINYWMK